MHRLDLPAGSPIRLTATARPNVGRHRWEVHVLASAQEAPLLIFGSEIGGGDSEQAVDIPAQAADCRLEVWARHATARGWDDDQATITDDTPSRLQISFCDPGSAVAQLDDVQLSFAFRTANPNDRR